MEASLATQVVVHHKLPLRIFLDTNVILTGAFNERGPAGTLGSLGPNATFLHSPFVLAECDQLLARDAPTHHIAELAALKVRHFLELLNSEFVPDAAPPPGCSAHDPADDLVLGSALASNTNVICTYNLRDFPTERIGVRTPLAIRRTIGGIALQDYIQPVTLSAHGTILFFGRLHHPSSMSQILRSDNGTTVAADEGGFIRLSGPRVFRQSARIPLQSNIEFRMTIRYNHTDFEAAVWRRVSNEWSKDVLTSGSATFSEHTFPILFLVPNHQFFGHVQSISGLPRYVRNKHLLSALDNDSLEAVAGSLDLKAFLQQFA